MYPSKRVNDSVQRCTNDLTSRIVADSGIPSDRHHLGKIILQSFKDAPGFVLQIDGATGTSESNGSVLERTVRCAIALKKIGLQRGDVITLMAPNHIDLAIPFYAALYLGVIVSPIDRTLGVNELRSNFEVSRPKVVFCQSERFTDVQLVLNGIQLESYIVTFDKFTEFLESHGDKTAIEEFRPTDFDPEDTIAVLISTSGTTGLPKSAAATHKNLAITYGCIQSKIHTQILLQPTHMIVSPTYLTKVITSEGCERCDFSSFEMIFLGGSAVSADLIRTMKKLAPSADVTNAYGMSEVTTLLFIHDGSSVNTATATIGKPTRCLQYRLIDIQTQEDIYEPNKNGELWVRGPGMVKGYYRNPEATKEAFTEDNWFKTGDILYRDENYNFFFVERIKLLLKYMNHQISPVELEATISQHPGVLDVAVTGLPDPKCGDLVVGCVVKRPGQDVTADEIKQLVKEKMADSKQLRGGVIFLDSIPQTANAKVDRRKVREIAMKMLIYK